MIGRELSHYRILEPLGRGGMGVVYLAEDTRLGRTVAIKLMGGPATAGDVARTRFLQEARAASSLDHPNICSIYEIDETPEGEIYLVMAHYDGETLDRRLARGPLPVREAVGMARQVAAGLAAAHARGIVHRDIKPANVMLTAGGMVKVLDFGLAKMAGQESLTMTGTSLGTPSYMSPEQVRAEPVGPPSDVWSAGVMLYALLAGRSPFEGENTGAIVYAILEGDPVPISTLLPRIPAELDAILARCFEKDPAKRYPDARGLAADLDRLALSLGPDDATAPMPVPIEASRTLRLSRSRSAPAARNRGLAVALRVAAVAGLAAAAGGGWVAWRNAHAPAPLRVAVLAPQVLAPGDSSEAALAASNALSSVLRGLAGRRGLAPLDASDLKGAQGFRQTVQALAADEVLWLSLAPAGEEWRGAIRRLSARDSSVLWAGDFAATREQALSLSDVLAAQVARAYPDHAPRAGASGAKIAAADYDEFLDLQRRFRVNFANDVPHDVMLSRLEALRRRAPGYLDAHLLEATWAAYQYETTHGAEDLALAMDAAKRARELAPDDPRPLTRLFNCSMLQSDWKQAEAQLDELRRLAPGDPDLLVHEARLTEGKGDRDAALRMMRRAIERRPARAYLERLARMEYTAGRYDEARADLLTLMSRYPAYVFPRSYLAQLELLYGAPARAESLYAALAAEFPRPVYLSNLGLARMLLGRYAEAAEVLRKAMVLAPDDVACALNFADCQALMKQDAEAAASYARVLADARKTPAAGDWQMRLTEAQCLAHLGRHEDAIAIAQEVLRTEGANADALFEAALIYAVAGESTSATVNTRKAIEAGIQPRWFGLPWFDALHADPEFQAALKASPRPAS